MDTYKAQITQIVRDYMQMFPAEYERFKNATRLKQEQQQNKFGLAKETTIELRALYDVPETLDTSFTMLLTEDCLKWFRSKEGSRWFATTFKTFRISEKV